MPLIEVFMLSLVQGLTEFLPISSSAHLFLWPYLFGQPDQGLAFDVSVHVGTLIAVVWYFRQDLQQLIQAGLRQCLGKSHCEDSAKLFWGMLLGTIPVGLAGLLGKSFVEQHLRSVTVIAIATILFALVLWWADKQHNSERRLNTLRIKDILLIGVAQCLALIPGTSRSGITITAGMMAGFSREEAARFSFLLSIPVIVLAGGLTTLDVIKGSVTTPWSDLLLGVTLSGVSAYACITLFMGWINRIGMLPFVIYRIALGVFLLTLVH